MTDYFNKVYKKVKTVFKNNPDLKYSQSFFSREYGFQYYVTVSVLQKLLSEGFITEVRNSNDYTYYELKELSKK